MNPTFPEPKMKLFTVEEANEMLPRVRVELERLRRLYSFVAEQRESAKAAATVSNLGGGMIGGTRYVQNLYEIGKITTEFNELGIQLKDYESGLIDFPSMYDGRVVLLCWKLGEPEQIEWYHEIEGGFQGRKPLEFDQ